MRDAECDNGEEEHGHGRDIPDMGNIIELSSDIVQQLRASEPMGSLDLRTEMTKDDDSWHFRSNEDRSD